MLFDYFFTHPDFNRINSAEICPSLKSERGKATLRWLACLTSLVGQGESELKYDNKYISLFKTEINTF